VEKCIISLPSAELLAGRSLLFFVLSCWSFCRNLYRWEGEEYPVSRMWHLFLELIRMSLYSF